MNSIHISPLTCYVYIIEGITGYVYCGITSNLHDRIEQHNSSKKDYKSKNQPFKYIYIKRLFSRKEARYYEKGIKAYGVRRWYDRESISNRIQASRIIIKALNLPVGIGGTSSTSEQVRTVPPMGI